MTTFSRCRQYVRTLRHLRPWQVAGRLVAPLRRWAAVRRSPDPPSRLRRTGPAPTQGPDHDPWNVRDDVLAGTFCFLNETAELGRPVDWGASAMPLLWRFNLHYFDYLHLLSPQEQVALCREWVAAHSPGQDVGWHPYPTSLRIVNWCRAGVGASDLLESLYRQAAYLSRTVETHVYGNHLLENARALVVAGRYLKGQGEADQWTRQGLELYRDELSEQVLSDGFHFERSPMYHALVLEGLLDVLAVLSDEHPDRGDLEQIAHRMTETLIGVTHPDEGLALFNDSTHEIAPPPDALRRYARQVLGTAPTPRQHFPEAGYSVFENDDCWLMVDGGPAGPEHLMAHAHADALSYELSLFGKRFVVDSGVYGYGSGPMRQYVRGTAAHNTVQIDGADQIECWDAFRVARRDAPRDVRRKTTESGMVFEGTFGGYRKILGDALSHRRRIEMEPESRLIRVADRVDGEGTHRLESRIHLHPAVEACRTDGGFCVRREDLRAHLDVEHGNVRREDGWYCPRFGVRHRICVLVIRKETALPAYLSYRIQY